MKIVDEEEVHRDFGGCLPVAALQPFVQFLKQRGDSFGQRSWA
ncbi:hypothetical protein [Thalassobacillus cyri]|nr:hypothetical protein [Thalassobacillus cyri]